MIAKVAVGLEIRKSFDYEAKGHTHLKKGMRVEVDFNRRKTLGFVVDIKKKSSSPFTLKPIIKVLDTLPAFPSNLLKLSEEISQQYLYSQGEILKMMLPAGLRTHRQLAVGAGAAPSKRRKPAAPKTTYIQENIENAGRLLYYRDRIREVLSSGGKVIVCLPGISDAFRFKDFFIRHLPGAKIAFFSGAQSPSAQLSDWTAMRLKEADICIGTRSSIFAPFEDVGLIIVEKENYYGYFQPVKPFYHLRDLAFLRAKKEKADLILHSDFPSLKLYTLIKDKKIDLLDLSVKGDPRLKVFDLKNYRFKRYAVFSDFAQEIMRRYLAQDKKVIIFWNRKGFSRILRCQHCGFALKPPQGGAEKEAKARCPECRKGSLRTIGAGIERLESRFKKPFGSKKIVKLSKDHRIESDDWDILIATQKLVFLPELPKAALVIVSGLDLMYSNKDYNASLELFLLLQRLKRVAAEELILFTFDPESQPVQSLDKDWQWFYERELKARRSLQFPPYVHIAKVGLRQKDKAAALKNITAFRSSLEKNLYTKDALAVYGPLEDDPFKSGGRYHFFLFIKAKRAAPLRKILDKTIRQFRKSSAKMSLVIN